MEANACGGSLWNRIIRLILQYLESFNSVQKEILVFDNNAWNHLTVRLQMSIGSFKDNAINKLFVCKSYMFDIDV